VTPDPAAGPARCGSCGTAPYDVARARLTWTVGVERGRTVWTCVDCSRRFLRGIEGKLDSDWWG
jgi:Zn-finger protein